MAHPHRRAVLHRLARLGGVTAAALGASLVTAAGAQANPAPGQKVQWPDVPLLDGGRFAAAQAEGRAVVAVFWSITCPFCRRHNEHVEKLHRAAKGRALAVLGISRDRDSAAVRRYVAERGYSFPITLDEAPLFAQLATRRVIPLTVTVDRQGRIKQSLAGEMFEEDVMELLALAA
jgi:peroxiredoxin